MPRFKPSKPCKHLFGTPNPADKGTKATSIAFYRRSSLPFARLQTLQTLQTPFWHPQPRRQRHQGHIAFYCRSSLPSGFKRSKPSKRLFGTPNPAGKGTKATSIAFYWRSSLPFAKLQTLQTLQTRVWHPQPRRQRHQGHINSFLLPFKPAVCQASNAPNLPNAFLAPPTPQAKAPRLINSFFLAFKPAVCQASNAPNHPNAFLAPPTPQAKAPRPAQ